MDGEGRAALGSAGLVLFAARLAFAATLEPHAEVRGAEIATVRVRAETGAWQEEAWDDLDRTARDPGHYEIRWRVDADRDGSQTQVPHCAGRERVALDGRDVSALPGPLVVPLSSGAHEVEMFVTVTAYERRIACGDRPRTGNTIDDGPQGLGVLVFPSRWSARGGGRAVVYVPPGHDPRTARPLLVGLHPWNGSMWTYAAYAPLLREARARDVLLLMPSGLGNSLYTADAEEEVMGAIAAASEVMAVDARAISIWGASMGGAGATTIGFHRPDRFASVTSFFGDSKYDRSTYVRSILPTEGAAHLVNALDVIENARHLPVWLIHGEADRTSPIAQSEQLAVRLREHGFSVRFDRVPSVGHSGALVARFLPALVAAAESARAAENVARVSYRSVRPSDASAYGVRWVRSAARGDALVDLERRGDAVHVLRAAGVRAIVLSRGALGTSTEEPPPIVIDDAEAGAIDARWDR